jgi:hypothetical protein
VIERAAFLTFGIISGYCFCMAVLAQRQIRKRRVEAAALPPAPPPAPEPDCTHSGKLTPVAVSPVLLGHSCTTVLYRCTCGSHFSVTHPGTFMLEDFLLRPVSNKQLEDMTKS